MNFIENYDLKVRGYIKVGPAKFDIAFDIKDYVNAGTLSLIEAIKNKAEKIAGSEGKADVKYNLNVSGFVDCLDVIKHAAIEFELNNDNVNA